MRASLFSLRSGSNSVVGSPVHTPIATPANPATRSDTLGHADVEPLSLPPPASTVQVNTTVPRTTRPLTRLSFTAFRKPNPSPAPAGREPSIVGTSPLPTPSASPAPSTVGSGSVSYLDALSLKLGEAVNKALVAPPNTHPAGIAKAAYIGGVATAASAKNGNPVDNPDFLLKGKRPIPPGRGRALGALISSELNHASNVHHDAFLHRAILRLLQRPLTVLITNLTQQVTNLLLSPEFTPTLPLGCLNATQVHALALAHFASELLETFDLLGLGRPSHRGQIANDPLRSIKEGLENVVTKVVGPIIAVIKGEVSGAIMDVEKDATCAADRLDKTLARVAPLLARVTFAGEAAQSTHIQSILATFEIGAIWTSLLALSNRPLPTSGSHAPVEQDAGAPLRRTVSDSKLRTQPSNVSLSTASGESSPPDYGRQLPSYITPPDTPQVVPVGGVEKKDAKRVSSGLSLAAAVTSLTAKAGPSSLLPVVRQPSPPSTKKLTMVKLPSLKPLAAVRAPSPPTVKVVSPGTNSAASSPTRSQSGDDFTRLKPIVGAVQCLARDAHTVFSAIKRFPLPIEGGLANDAVNEAMKEMVGFVDFIDYIAADNCKVVLSHRNVGMERLMNKTRETPLLLALPVLLRISLSSSCVLKSLCCSPPTTVAGWIGLSEDEYRNSCLSGFAKAEECATIVGNAFLRNPKAGGLCWLKLWLETSVREEEESDDEDDGPQHA